MPDVTGLREAIGRGATTARQALEHCLERIDASNGSVNAVVRLDMEGARDTADRRDRENSGGRSSGPLHGVPVTVKECFDWRGHPTTWGDPQRAEHEAEDDSVVVARLKRAGAVVLGKTNIPPYLGDWETANPVFGETRNPHDTELSAGGSSGGSAAAVASGMSYADIGSDHGGSIRLPAHYCGVVGLKPSWGLIPMAGHSPLDETRDPDIGVAGPITRSARDASLLIDALAGPADPDAAWQLRLPKAEPRSVGDLRVAVLLENDQCPVDDGYLNELQGLVAMLGNEGATVSMDAGPDIDLVRHTELMNLLVRAETSTKAHFKSSHAVGEKTGDSKARRHVAMAEAGTGLSHREWLHLHEERLAFQRAWDRFFSDHDVLVCPVAASAAPPFRTFGDVSLRTIPVNGEEQPVLEQHFWLGLASLSGLPALSVPIGQVASGLPVGVQLIGPRHRDHALCALAGQIADMMRPAERFPE